MENRTIQRLRGDLWTDVEFESLELDDSFRIIEPTGDIMTDEDGKIVFVVTNEPYINDMGQRVVEVEGVE